MALRAEEISQGSVVELGVVHGPSLPELGDFYLGSDQFGVEKYRGEAPVGVNGKTYFTLEGRTQDLKSNFMRIMVFQHGHLAPEAAYDRPRSAYAHHEGVALTLDDSPLMFHRDNANDQIFEPVKLQADAEVAVIDLIDELVKKEVSYDATGHSQGGRAAVTAARLRPEAFKTVTLAGAVGLTGRQIVRINELVELVTLPFVEEYVLVEALLRHADIEESVGKAITAARHIGGDVIQLGKFILKDVLLSLPQVEVTPSPRLFSQLGAQLGNPFRRVLEGLSDNSDDLIEDVDRLRAMGILMINNPFIDDTVFNIQDVERHTKNRFDAYRPFKSNHLGPQLFPKRFTRHVAQGAKGA